MVEGCDPTSVSSLFELRNSALHEVEQKLVCDQSQKHSKVFDPNSRVPAASMGYNGGKSKPTPLLAQTGGKHAQN